MAFTPRPAETMTSALEMSTWLRARGLTLNVSIRGGGSCTCSSRMLPVELVETFSALGKRLGGTVAMHGTVLSNCRDTNRPPYTRRSIRKLPTSSISSKTQLLAQGICSICAAHAANSAPVRVAPTKRPQGSMHKSPRTARSLSTHPGRYHRLVEVTHGQHLVGPARQAFVKQGLIVAPNGHDDQRAMQARCEFAPQCQQFANRFGTPLRENESPAFADLVCGHQKRYLAVGAQATQQLRYYLIDKLAFDRDLFARARW